MNDHNFLPSSGWLCSSFIGILSVSFFLLILLFKKRSRDAVSETIKINTDQYDENIIQEWRDGLGDVGTLNGLESYNVADDGCNVVVANRELVEFLGVDKGGIELSQRSLINTVFIHLNDEEQMKQLVATAANFDSCAPGSSIIFVRSGKGVMGALQGKESCAVRKMQFHDAFVLFCKGAFRGDSEAADYVGLLMTSTTARLPLALELVGSYLFGEKKLAWRNIFKKFKAISHQGIKDLLRISFGTLDCDEKQIVIDIACFFIGTDKRIAFRMWEDCNSFAEDGIAVLLAMSLVKIRHQNKLCMHDQLLSLLGEEIVLPGNYNEMVAKHTVPSVEVAVDVHGSCMGTTELESIHSDDGTTLEGDFLKSQELLSQWESDTIDGWKGWGSVQMAYRLKILVLMSCQNLKETPNFSWFPLLEKLRLEHCTSLEVVDPSIGSLQNLISFGVKYCRKMKVLPQELGSLKALTELCIDGTCVKELPPLKGLKMLATLSARNCKLLPQIPSIGQLTSLVELRLDKSGVCQIPDSIAALAKLKELHLDHTSIHTLPDSIGELHNLEVLKVSSSNITQLPSALRKLEKLKVINASSCVNLDGEGFQDMRLYSLRTLTLDNTNIRMLPASFHNLQTLDLTGCDKLVSLPELPKSLQSLSVTCKPIVALPNLSNLVSLEELQLVRCKNLGELPSDIGKLSKLKKLSISHSRISMLPEEISTLSQLHDLAIRNCKDLKCIPKLPESLDKLEVKGISAKKLNLSNSANLLELRLSDCSKLEEISGLGCLTSLRIFLVSKCTELTELDGLEKLESLRELHMSECDSLDVLPDLSKLRQLYHLVLHQCISLNSLPGLFGLKELRCLDLYYCKKLQELEGLEELESLQTLDISGCKEMEVLPSLSRLQNLKDLSVRGCDKLQEIRGLEELRSQLSVYTHGCTSLQNISNSRNIKIQG